MRWVYSAASSLALLAMLLASSHLTMSPTLVSSVDINSSWPYNEACLRPNDDKSNPIDLSNFVIDSVRTMVMTGNKWVNTWLPIVNILMRAAYYNVINITVGAIKPSCAKGRVNCTADMSDGQYDVPDGPQLIYASTLLNQDMVLRYTGGDNGVLDSSIPAHHVVRLHFHLVGKDEDLTKDNFPGSWSSINSTYMSALFGYQFTGIGGYAYQRAAIVFLWATDPSSSFETCGALPSLPKFQGNCDAGFSDPERVLSKKLQDLAISHIYYYNDQVANVITSPKLFTQIAYYRANALKHNDWCRTALKTRCHHNVRWVPIMDVDGNTEVNLTRAHKISNITEAGRVVGGDRVGEHFACNDYVIDSGDVEDITEDNIAAVFDGMPQLEERLGMGAFIGAGAWVTGRIGVVVACNRSPKGDNIEFCPPTLSTELRSTTTTTRPADQPLGGADPVCRPSLGALGAAVCAALLRPLVAAAGVG
eukprot:GHVU01130953.1.p1 GENE.GHVU01130953.1~~GHVU01130953.1.p1  ORF type:complete len:477 (-),score=27.21 GHVU01130953.1:1486-2916(-)